MRRACVTSLLLAVAVSLAHSPAEAAPKRVKDLKQIKTPPITFQRPEPVRRELSNGMVVFLLENHRLPLVNLQAWTHTGSVYEPDAQAGVAQLTGMMLRMGGTTAMSADAVDEALDFLAADVSTGVNPLAGTAALDVPSRSFEEALGILANILMHPGFAEDKIVVAKGQIKEQIRRQNDNPVAIAVREFTKLLYGENHPAARQPTFASVDRLTRDQLFAFHQRFYCPNNTMVAVGGDFDSQKIEQHLLKAFAGWEKREVTFPPVPETKELQPTNVNVARKPLPQSTILVGHLGTTVYDPNHRAVQVMNSILGGGSFSSRIIETVRNDRGLAYACGSGYQVGTKMPGAFIGYSLTNAESTTVALELLLEEIARIREAEVGPEELETARNMQLNSEVFNYDTTEKIVNRLLFLEYFGLPKDYLEKGLEEVAKMDRATVLRVAREYLHPDKMTIMVVGDPDKFAQPLSAVGAPVREITLSDPTKEGGM